MSRGRWLGLLAAGVLAAGCGVVQNGAQHRIGSEPYEKGSGKVATETRSLAAFHAVSASQGVTVFVSNGTSASAAVRADDNLLDNVSTQVSNGTLVVGVSGSIETSNELQVTVTAAQPIDSIAADSGATLDFEQVEAAAFSASAGSGSTLRAGGRTTSLELNAGTGATADLRNVETASATVHVDTGSTAFVNASQSVGGSCSLGSTLHVRGAATLQVGADTSSTIKRD